MSLSFSASRDHADRRDLRHADAGDDARRADRARTDADLDRVRAGIDQRLGRIAGHDVAGDDRHVRIRLARPAHAFDHAARMTVRGIDDEHVDARVDQRRDALFGIAADADRRADAQAFAIVLARVRIVARLLDVLDRDQAAQTKRIVDDQHLLDAVLVQQRQHFVLGSALLHRDQPLLARHDVLDRILGLLLEAQVAVGDDADELLAIDHRHAGDVVRARDLHDFADRGLRRHRDRIADHARFELLDQAHFGRLAFDGHVLVDDADAAGLRHRDGEARFGDGIHRRRDDRQVQADRAGQAGAKIDVARKYARKRGNERNVVEGESFGEDAHDLFYRHEVVLARDPGADRMRRPDVARNGLLQAAIAPPVRTSARPALARTVCGYTARRIRLPCR